MNFQQLEYILALEKTGQFIAAAQSCFVTQATLSHMVKKLEEELGVGLFDRDTTPITPTPTGKEILRVAREIIHLRSEMFEVVLEQTDTVSGEFRLGIIPTLAPYMLPVFLTPFLAKYPEVTLVIHELTTDEIVNRLKNHDLDAGLLAIPVQDKTLVTYHLFFEEFLVYAPSLDPLLKKKYVLPNEIDVNRLWLLEEGHCLRDQVVNLCELKSREKAMHRLDFAAGSLETLRRMVEMNQGITILPDLAARELSTDQEKNLRHFKDPSPVREIGLITHKHLSKKKIFSVLEATIMDNLPSRYKNQRKKKSGVNRILEHSKG